MGGIGGILNWQGKPVDIDVLTELGQLVKHRGPAYEGYLLLNTETGKQRAFLDEGSGSELKKELNPLFNADIKGNLGFAYRGGNTTPESRLNRQPIYDLTGTYYIVFDGNLYNREELARELASQGYESNSSSDAEVVINAYTEWGFECQNRFRGIWSFALWDSSKKLLFCSRDRFGVKPFYYSYESGTFLFGSELKQVHRFLTDRQLNEKMLYRLLKMGSFLFYGDETLFQKAKVLPHSHFMILSSSGLRVERYYDLPKDQFETSSLSFSDASTEYRERFRESIELYVSDSINVGCSLSGGLDSSAIVAQAYQITSKPIRTFTAYYDNSPGFDERAWIDKLGESIKIDPYFISPKPEDFIRDFYKVTYLQDYPIIGSSPLTQYYVMKLASENGVGVILDGQGSDEINIGYAHSFYRYYADLLNQKRGRTFVKEFSQYLTSKGSKSVPEKIVKTMLVYMFSESYRYKKEVKHNLPNLLLKDFKEDELIGEVNDLPVSKLSSFLYNLVMTIYLQTLLHYVDRNSMAFSIESRTPFLDHKLVEFLFSLPAEYKIKGGISKRIHRDAMQELVPEVVLNRKDKVNFASPAEAYWLKNEMGGFMQGILQSSSFKNRDLFNLKRIDKIYKEYLAGRRSHGFYLWKVISIEIWLRVFLDDYPV